MADNSRIRDRSSVHFEAGAMKGAALFWRGMGFSGSDYLPNHAIQISTNYEFLLNSSSARRMSRTGMKRPGFSGGGFI